jgi:glycosyltransferase involved in cell wall biosynthesis
MRIALIIHRPQARGQEIFASLLGNFLLKLGHEVVVLSLYQGEFILPFKGTHFQLNAKSLGLKNLRQFSQHLRDFNPDIVQANGGDTLKFAVLSRLVFPFEGKLIFNNGGVVGYYLRSYFHRLIYGFLLARVDGAVSVSEFSGNELKKWIPAIVPQGVIPIGIPREMQFALVPPVSHPVFVHIGGFTPEKNHAFLLDLFQDFLEKVNPHAQLWLIGDGPYKIQIQESCSLELSKAIRFFGAIADPWSVVPANAILLLPSKIEGMPSVIAEAFLAQIPVIASSVGGIPEMANAIPSCSLVSLEDKNAWLKVMDFWATLSAEEKSKLTTPSKAKANIRFDLKRAAEAFLEFYQRL